MKSLKTLVFLTLILFTTFQSSQALIKVIEDEESKSLKNDNALYTIQLVFRGDLAKAVNYLEQSMNGSATKAGKERLQIAVDKIKAESVKNKASN
jgi:hypothetical protein